MKYYAFIILLFTFSFLRTQNVYEIYINGYAEGRTLKGIQYTLIQNDNVVVEQNSKNGAFQFIIMENDGYYSLKATKEEYVPKVIHFNSIEYPFTEEYEIQEIDVEFHLKEVSGEEIEIGELKWSNLSESFNVVKVDSTFEVAKKQYASSEQSLGEIYIKAIETGDELLNMGEPRPAKRNYEIALLAKPKDMYAQNKITEIEIMLTEEKEIEKEVRVFSSEEVLDKINKGEIQDLPADKLDPNAIYSVQLGAFSQKIDLNKFADVPDFKTIEYDDYTRCFSGEFTDPNVAIQRKNDMVSKGYKDAWIVIMKGNQRIGF